MFDSIREITSLQPLYSSKNTPEMKRRGHLIRNDLPAEIKSKWKLYSSCIKDFADDLSVEGKDGIGRKTQAPWVRIFSRQLSPSATMGFYLVIHFAADGRSFFITLGCGASKWDSEKGDLVQYTSNEIKSRVDWALKVIGESGALTSYFSDKIELGSRHSLPKSFERATILCKTFDVPNFNETEVSEAICKGLSLLSIVYANYSIQSDLPSSDILSNVIEDSVNPIKKNINSRQGYGLNGPERKAVEMRAMEVTREYLSQRGYTLEDCSSNKPYDYLARREKEIKVEVKGTTSSYVDSIMMTSNEVDLHSRECGTTALSIVSDINFVERGENPICEGGVIEYFYPWDINDWSLEPKAYLVRKK